MQTQAITPDNYDVSTTGDLIALCSVSVDDPLYNAAMGFCLGYIDAAMDYHEALTAGGKYDAVACPDTKVAREEVVGVFVDWSNHNAQYLEVETPVLGVMRAAAEKWPCPKK
jgi:hypothetical protein